MCTLYEIAIIYIKFYTETQNLNIAQVCPINPETKSILATRSKKYYLTYAQSFWHQQINYMKILLNPLVLQWPVS